MYFLLVQMRRERGGQAAAASWAPIHFSNPMACRRRRICSAEEAELRVQQEGEEKKLPRTTGLTAARRTAGQAAGDGRSRGKAAAAVGPLSPRRQIA